MNREQRNQLESLFVEMILAIRRSFILARKGKVPMGYWDRIQDMIRVGTNTTVTLSEWCNSVQQDLQIQGLDSSGCRALTELVAWVDEHSTQLDALYFIEKNTPLCIALARQAVEERKAADKSAKSDALGSLTPEAIEQAAKDNGLWAEEIA